MDKVHAKVEELAVKHYPSFLKAEDSIRTIEVALDQSFERLQKARQLTEDSLKVIPSGADIRCEQQVAQKNKARTALLMHSQVGEVKDCYSMPFQFS